ncbi:hypothetical protein C7M84_019391 [Penaeus vannamei]|uniref:Uncharacterized protein n=1 Tax=Penaeus vannamei TaxID=6689 RepID=A0A423SEU8_PENVA|nr:hypothetical protein C7M84_019391 [Penaeus vannamei]
MWGTGHCCPSPPNPSAFTGFPQTPISQTPTRDSHSLPRPKTSSHSAKMETFRKTRSLKLDIPETPPSSSTNTPDLCFKEAPPICITPAVSSDHTSSYLKEKPSSVGYERQSDKKKVPLPKTPNIVKSKSGPWKFSASTSYDADTEELAEMAVSKDSSECRRGSSECGYAAVCCKSVEVQTECSEGQGCQSAASLAQTSPSVKTRSKQKPVKGQTNLIPPPVPPRNRPLKPALKKTESINWLDRSSSIVDLRNLFEEVKQSREMLQKSRESLNRSGERQSLSVYSPLSRTKSVSNMHHVGLSAARDSGLSHSSWELSEARASTPHLHPLRTVSSVSFTEDGQFGMHSPDDVYYTIQGGTGVTQHFQLEEHRPWYRIKPRSRTHSKNYYPTSSSSSEEGFAEDDSLYEPLRESPTMTSPEAYNPQFAYEVPYPPQRSPRFASQLSHSPPHTFHYPLSPRSPLHCQSPKSQGQPAHSQHYFCQSPQHSPQSPPCPVHHHTILPSPTITHRPA